jgi:predicted nucleic acid-binding protein
VSNTSAIIALVQVGQLDLLSRLFTQVTIPSSVRQELGPTFLMPAWLIEKNLAQPVSAQVLNAQLGKGESEAISLAVELQARWVILDDRPARRLAEALGLPLIGTLGILLAAKRHGFVASVRPVLDSLASFGFHIAPALRERVLVDAGEVP